jgi:hypothetical protein
MGVVAKMFLQQAKIQPDGATLYDLGVVCRGEDNKDWAAATPSGSGVLAGEVLDAVWANRVANGSPAEVLVYQIPDPDGDFVMKSCEFSYGGGIVKFFRDRNAPPYGLKLELTINAKPATEQLRKAFAEGLLAGAAPRYRIEFADAASED